MTSRVSVKNLAKEVKKISRAFNTVITQLQRLKKSEYNLSESEDEDTASQF